MVIKPQQYLPQLATYLEVPLGKIKTNENSIYSTAIGSKTVNGIGNIVFSMLEESKRKDLSHTDYLQLQQWIDFAMIYAVYVDEPQSSSQILEELNDILLTRTYLIAHRLSIADVMLYYILANTMAAMSYMDKPKYLHLCRWYETLQSDSHIRQNNKLVNFGINHILCFEKH